MNTELGNSLCTAENHCVAQGLFIDTITTKETKAILQLQGLRSCILGSLGVGLPTLGLPVLPQRVLSQQVNQLRPITFTAGSEEGEGYLGSVISRWHPGGDLMKIQLCSRGQGHRQPDGRTNSLLPAL